MADWKKLAAAGLCLTLTLASGCGWRQLIPAATTPATQAVQTEQTVPTAAPTTQPIPETTQPAPTEPQPETFLLTFVGDCTFGTNQVNAYAEYGFTKTVGQDYGYPFRNVADYVNTDDGTFLNLEGPLCDEGNPVQKKHTFRGPTEYVSILTENSIQAVTVANNHAFDYGQTGYDSTLAVLEEVGIPYVQRDSSVLLTLEGGLKVGLYGMVYYLLDVQDMTQEIQALREQGAELVIVAPHWGTEGSYRPTQEQIDVGHAAIDAGADIVWGSHPHVLQPVEEYGDGVIFYSLGNFSFGGNGYPQDFDTALIQQEVIRQSDGSISLGQRTLVPASVSSVSDRNNYQPTPYDPGSEAYDRVLSKLDGTFQGPNLQISG